MKSVTHSLYTFFTNLHNSLITLLDTLNKIETFFCNWEQKCILKWYNNAEHQSIIGRGVARVFLKWQIFEMATDEANILVLNQLKRSNSPFFERFSTLKAAFLKTIWHPHNTWNCQAGGVTKNYTDLLLFTDSNVHIWLPSNLENLSYFRQEQS